MLVVGANKWTNVRYSSDRITAISDRVDKRRWEQDMSRETLSVCWEVGSGAARHGDGTLGRQASKGKYCTQVLTATSEEPADTSPWRCEEGSR